MPDGDLIGRARQRAAFFAGMATRVADALPKIRQGTEFRADSPLLMAWVYFLLSDAYKPFRTDGLTDDYKKAALSAVSVMVVRPFTPLDPHNVRDLTVYLANPILAMACANAWAADRNLLEHFPFDYLKRFYISLLNIRMPSLDRFCEAINEGGDYGGFTMVRLTPAEIAVLDDWTLKIYMLVNLKR